MCFDQKKKRENVLIDQKKKRKCASPKKKEKMCFAVSGKGEGIGYVITARSLIYIHFWIDINRA